jgi:hypothetical protein
LQRERGKHFQMKHDLMDESYHINLIIAVLMRFPEVFTINFNPAEPSFSVTYMLREELKRSRYISFSRQLNEYMEYYYYFRQKNWNVQELSVKVSYYQGMSQLEVILPSNCMFVDEISFLNSLVRDEFADILVADFHGEDNDMMEKTASSWNELMSVLISGKNSDLDNNLFAFRESGKVYVFNR